MAIGAGALGSLVLTNLARSGYGRLTVVDDDVLHPHNLARHTLSVVLLKLLGSSSLALQRQHGLRQPPPDEFAVFRVDFDPDCPPPQIRRRP